MEHPAAGANALGDETSPYLLQHADNPVAWYPWKPEALATARSLGKPILLSIGYSACHWCHVMAHESFEDDETARLMNELFVNIKVDREERPDLDRIYQTAHQLLTQRGGGWPLTVFLTPDDHTPFYCGTYFPRQSRYGMPAFKDVLTRIAAHYREHRDDLGPLREQIVAAFESMESRAAPPGAYGSEPITQARAELARSYDANHGGFGGAPKFPHPTNMELLLRAYAAGGEGARESLDMAVHTLRCMVEGGLYDQLGGGFCRYSVDERWMIPHFEKMLYDNGPLLELCARAWRLTGDALFAKAARETGEWVVREMQSGDGGYYSTIDADSEGEEGKFYVWSLDEVRTLLDERQLRVLVPHFGLDRPANFEGTAWHLHTFVPLAEVAAAEGLSEREAHETLAAAKSALLEAREGRVRPGLDDKVLTAWNGLMIRAMARAANLLEAPHLAASATLAVDFIGERHWRDGRLLATSRDGRAQLDAYLDDHAFMIDGLLALLEYRWRRADLDFAVALAEVLLERFEDRERGGFYFTAADHEALLHRPKPFADDALPAGNAVAARALARLGHLLGETRYLDAAERALGAAWSGIERYPFAHAAMLGALEDQLDPPRTVVIRGTGEALERWRRRAVTAYDPQRLTLAIPDDEPDLPALLAARAPAATTVAYVCRGHQCDAPTTRFEDFERVLAEHEV